MQKLTKTAATLALLGLAASGSHAQTVITYYNFANATAQAAGGTFTPTQGAGSLTDSFANTVVSGTNTVGSYFVSDTGSGSNGNAINFAFGTTTTNYIQFSATLTGQTDPGLILSYATQRSATGPSVQTVQFSTDATFTTGVTTLGTYTVPTAFGLASFSLSGLGLDTVAVPEYFRITATTAGTGTTGTNRFDNVFIGVPAATPEPSSVVSMLLGAGVLGLIAVRRRTINAA